MPHGKRHVTVKPPTKKPKPTRCAQPCCWQTVLGVKCTCRAKKGRCAAAKAQESTRAKRTKKKGLEKQLGLTEPLYPGFASVRDGATAQFTARYGPLRRAGQGGRQPEFVTPKRKPPKRLVFN